MIVGRRPSALSNLSNYALLGAKHGFQIGERGIGAPERLFVPIQQIGAQAIGARIGESGSSEKATLIASFL
jgi:hypothetical protein